nr:uncharacterized protein LOC117989008 [Maniola hyperantus]
MLNALLRNKLKAARAIHAAKGDKNLIPAGINLGGYCMMRLPKSILFFHRMKLRNNTNFRITSLKTDISELKINAHIMLNDLHLFGSYDFTNILNKPNILSYDPTFGQVELLLKNVSYKMEGRYRILRYKLIIELIVSEIDLDDVIVMYRNKDSSQSVSLQRKNIDIFIDRLKVDLDKWLKDYFNDDLMYGIGYGNARFDSKTGPNTFSLLQNHFLLPFRAYSQKRTMALNQYADRAIDKVLERLNEIKANAINLPSFELHTMSVAEISLSNGVLRGLDSIYRRSIATGSRRDDVRAVNTVVGFSNLKLSYRYDALLQSGPPVTGVLTLTADDLTAHMALSLTRNPEAVDLSFTFLEQAKPEFLTIEGPANRMISNFKYMLERHIIALMTNTLMHSIKMLGTLTRCVPLLSPYKEAEAKTNNTDRNEHNQNSLGSIKNNNETDTTDTDTDEVPPSEDIKKETNKNDNTPEPSEESENSENYKNEIPQNPSQKVEKGDEESSNQNEDHSNKTPSQELNENDDNNTRKGNHTSNIVLPGFVGNWTEAEKQKLIEKGGLRSKLKQKKRIRFRRRN